MAQPWPGDPWADRRVVMREEEFDAVDYFVHEPGRTPPPPPTLGVYLDSALSQPQFAERLGAVVADLSAVLAETVEPPMYPSETACAVRGRAVSGRPWRGDSTLRWLADALRTGEVESFDLSFHGPDDPQDRSWYLECACLPDRSDAAIQMSLTPSDNLWPAGDTDAVAERLLDLVTAWSTGLELLTGCVTLDRVQPGYTPWELWYGAGVELMAPLTRDHVRGYYWANLLTSGHLERLGDLDALCARAADHGFVVGRPGPPGPPGAVVLRSPSPVTGFDDTQLAAMKDVLAPVLVARRYTQYEGWPLRIVRDPGTAFRRVPTTEPRPHLISADEERPRAVAAHVTAGGLHRRVQLSGTPDQRDVVLGEGGKVARPAARRECVHTLGPAPRTVQPTLTGHHNSSTWRTGKQHHLVTRRRSHQAVRRRGLNGN
jgi:hypothetical protein